MKKTVIFIAMAVLCLFFGAHGQEMSQTKPLGIGNKVPDLVFQKILNGDRNPISIADLKGKALILDFWATWCTACFKSFPKLYEYQSTYGRNLKVLLVADSKSDTESKVSKFVQDREGGDDAFKLPVAFHDALTKALFPHTAFPHFVWIGADRRVKAITGADALTQENIEGFLAGRDLFLKRKGY